MNLIGPVYIYLYQLYIENWQTAFSPGTWGLTYNLAIKMVLYGWLAALILPLGCDVAKQVFEALLSYSLLLGTVAPPEDSRTPAVTVQLREISLFHKKEPLRPCKRLSLPLGEAQRWDIDRGHPSGPDRLTDQPENLTPRGVRCEVAGGLWPVLIEVDLGRGVTNRNITNKMAPLGNWLNFSELNVFVDQSFVSACMTF